MEDDELLVLSELNIEFDIVGIAVEGSLEGVHSIFGSLLGSAAVSGDLGIGEQTDIKADIALIESAEVSDIKEQSGEGHSRDHSDSGKFFDLESGRLGSDDLFGVGDIGEESAGKPAHNSGS